MTNILKIELRTRNEQSPPIEEEDRNSKSPDSVNRSRRKYFLLRVVGIILITISAYFYIFGLIYYRAVLDLGFTGAFCERCSSTPNGIPLVVVPRSPAYEAGMQSGDNLLEVDGKSIEDYSLPTGIDEPWGFFGPAGSSLSVTLERGGKTKTFDLIREKGWNENATLGLRILNISESSSNFIALFEEVVIVAIFFASGLFLFLSRSNEPMVMLTGVTLTLAGFIFTRSIIYLPGGPTKYIYISLINFALPTLFLFFPNGKLTSRREYILILGYLSWQLYFGFYFSEGDHYTFRRYADVFYWLYVIGSLSFRYRNKFTQEQVQQTKWIYTSLLVIFLTGIFFIFTFSIFFSPESSNVRSNLINSLGFTALRLTSILLPISLILATRRYNLWQVDVVLNRIEIASILGIVIGIAFIILVAVFKELADQILGVQSALIATTISTIIITYLFQPIQKKIESIINRKFYSVELDLLKNFVEIEPDAWKLIPLSHLLDKVIVRICKVFRNQWGAVLLFENGNHTFAIAHNMTTDKLDTAFLTESNISKLRKGELINLRESRSKFSTLVPLFLPDLDQHVLQAIVCLGPREKNRGYSSDDKKALREFGEKVGIAIYMLRN